MTNRHPIRAQFDLYWQRLSRAQSDSLTFCGGLLFLSFFSRGTKYKITAVINSEMENIHIHSDFNDEFIKSSTTTTQTRIAATVLICNATNLFQKHKPYRQEIY
jgi:hypothetical protein